MLRHVQSTTVAVAVSSGRTTTRSKWFAIALVICGSAGVNGCGTSGPTLPAAGTVTSMTPISTRADWKMATFAPLHGAPASVQSQMAVQITREALKHGIVLRVDQGAAVDFTLRGYLLVERVKTSAKVVYVWDVVDQKGNRLNRVAGEEVVAASSATGDRWDAVTPAVLAMIAEKAVECLRQSGAPAGSNPTGGAASALGRNVPG